MKKLVYIGLDVHRDTIVIAVARSGREPAMQLATIPHDTIALVKLLDDLGPRSRLRVCYEAGPTGYGLSRQLNESGICCVVVAPSLVPVQQGRRIKTDRRDAVKLAHFLRSGDLVEVSVPAAQNEAMRDLNGHAKMPCELSVSREISCRSSCCDTAACGAAEAIGLALIGAGCCNWSSPKTPTDACGMIIWLPSSIRLRGPDDEPLPGVPLHFFEEEVQYPGPRTDARGEYLFIHPPFPRGFGVEVAGSEARHCDDEPVVTLRYAAGELPPTLPPRRLALRVLADDGRPAAGWFVTSDAYLSGAGGSIPATSITQFYVCRSLDRLNPEGAANVELINDLLIVVSPQGLPFRFRLNPAAWPDETRRLTLSIPPLREMHAGRLVWQDGTPIDRAALVVDHIAGPVVNWRLGKRVGRFGEDPLWRMAADDGTAIQPPVTDDRGCYELPLYYGGHASYRLATNEYFPERLESRGQISLKRSTARAGAYRDVTIVYRDAEGRLLPEVEIYSVTTYHGKQAVSRSSRGGAIVDRRGWHILVPEGVDGIEFDSNSAHWLPRHELRAIPAHDVQFDVVLG